MVGEGDSRVPGLFGRVEGMAMKVVLMLKRVPLPADVGALHL